MTRAEWLAAYEREVAEFVQQRGLSGERAEWPEADEAAWRERWHEFVVAHDDRPADEPEPWTPEWVRWKLAR